MEDWQFQLFASLEETKPMPGRSLIVFSLSELYRNKNGLWILDQHSGGFLLEEMFQQKKNINTLL